jgi:predicted dienelactone hydrolase
MTFGGEIALRRVWTQAWTLLVWAAVLTAQTSPPGKVQAPVLPRPKGLFAVGRTGFDWTDQSRREVLSRNVDAKRELMVYVWYPAEKRAMTGKPAPYLPGAAAINKLSDRALSGADGKLWPAILSGQVVSHAFEGATPATSPARFPLLVFSHGFGSPVFHYTAFIEELVSHGYVVASIQHTYEVNVLAFPDGRTVAMSPISWSIYGPQLPGVSEQEASRKAIAWEKERDSVWAADISFTLDQLTKLDQDRGSLFFGRLDLANIGALGHSIGGRAVGRACQLDRRIRACVNEDGAPDEGAVFNYPGTDPPTQPFLLEEAFVAPPTDQELAEAHESRQHFNESITQQDAAIKKQLSGSQDGGYRVTIKAPGINHDSFTDVPLMESADDPAAEAAALHSLSLTVDVTLAFFDQYLKGEKHRLLDRIHESPREISVRHYERGDP